MRFALALPLACGLVNLVVHPVARAQTLGDVPVAIPGAEATTDELRAFQSLQLEQYIQAREQASTILKSSPKSTVAHLVLGFVNHYAEGNFARALYHLNIAEDMTEARQARGGAPGQVSFWTQRLLHQLAITHNTLEHYGQALAYMDKFNRRFGTTFIAERAWPLMKLGRFDDATRAARAGLAEGSTVQTERALNALCAIGFESGNVEDNYQECKAALNFGKAQPGGASVVDYTNFSESARALFKLDEAELALVEASRAQTSWYGNPWVDLAELYTRQGRLLEALGALKKSGPYRMRRPAHVREVDRNEGRRAVASFLLVASKPNDVIRISAQALVAPDRNAHNSRDPRQDITVHALLDRRARLMRAELALERAHGWISRLWVRITSFADRFRAWLSGRQAVRALNERPVMVGALQVGTAKGAIMPPWLAGDLCAVVGPRVYNTMITRARQTDDRSTAQPYYKAFAAEGRHCAGTGRATQLTRAADGLGESERLLRVRLRALAAHAAWSEGKPKTYAQLVSTAFDVDPGVFRRLSLPLHVRVASGALRDLVAGSPRFHPHRASPLRLTRRSDADQTQACLETNTEVLRCVALTGDARAARARLHTALFAPALDLSQSDIHSLDGSNRAGTITDDMLEGL